MVGTFLYFAIVFSLPICMGMAAVALDLPVRFLQAAAPLLLLQPASASFNALLVEPFHMLL